ncbi:MAG: putative DNA modification/repair radical SAM protein [Succiniclasticum sp.]
MDVLEKLKILADAAKYDAACTSSGVERKGGGFAMGSSRDFGICHSFAGDGRCISLLKVLLTNCCSFDCVYCVNRRSNRAKRTAFTPRELADLTWQFYRRNYIEGLFLSSAVWKSPDYTSEQMLQVLEVLRYEYRFGGYIHVKVIPGTDPLLIDRLGMLADRISVNIELPSSGSLQKLAPDKSKDKILLPMGQIQNKIMDNRQGRGRFGGILPIGSRRLLQKPWKKGTGTFAPAGQSTQMIVGASPETDRQILRLTESLYHRYRMKRVFYSAYIPVVEDSRLPSKDITPPLWREHRLYQADWLLRFYGFSASELLDEKNPQLHPYLDPKCHWAVRHPELFPMEVNRASFDELVRVPGVGVESALRILRARKLCPLTWDGLKNIGVVLKRARYFLLCKGKPFPFLSRRKEDFLLAMMSPKERALFRKQECSWFQPSLFTESDLASDGDESTGLTAIALPGLDDRQKEALQCISIPVFS